MTATFPTVHYLKILLHFYKCTSIIQYATKTKKRRQEERGEKPYTATNRKKENFTSTAQKDTNCILLVRFLKNILKLCFKALAESTKPFFYWQLRSACYRAICHCVLGCIRHRTASWSREGIVLLCAGVASPGVLDAARNWPAKIIC